MSPRGAATSSAPRSGRMHLTEKEFASLATLIETSLGIQMPHGKQTMLETRLIRRLRQLKISGMGEYFDFLLSPDGKARELSTFLDIVTTNKTSFFRELPQLTFLENEVLPGAMKNAAAEGRPYRGWSAACSTGQEVWTLGIMFDQVARRERLTNDFFVLGSDVSGRVLKTAIAAKYDAHELDDDELPVTARQYFMKSKDPAVPLVRVHPNLRSRAGFFRQNLMDESYHTPDAQDLILIRNALIYFPRDRQGQIVSRALRCLRPGGILGVGLTETLHGFSLPVRHLGNSLYQLTEKP